MSEPYSEVYSAAGLHRWADPEKGPCVPGVRRVLVTREGVDAEPRTHFHVDWDSRETADLHRSDLAARLPAGAARLGAGVRSQEVPGPPSRRQRTWAWIRRGPAVVLGLVAVLGALEALRARHAWLLASPDVSVAFPGSRRHRVSVGKPFSIPVRISDQSVIADFRLLTSVSCRVQAPAPPGGSGAAVDLRPLVLSSRLVPTGGSLDLDLTGEARRPGEARVEVEVFVPGGKWGDDCRRVESVALEVWPERAFSALEAVLLEPRAAKSARCLAQGALRAGLPAPGGLECSVVLDEDQPAELVRLWDFGQDGDGAQPLLDSRPPGQRRIGFTWTTHGLAAFDEVLGSVALQATRDLTLGEWAAIVAHLRFGPIEPAPLAKEPR